MPSIKTTRNALPDPPETLTITSNDGQTIGTLRFTFKNGTTSVLEYAAGQQPHQPYPLRAKYRQR